MSQEGFWDDTEKAAGITREANSIEEKLRKISSFAQRADDIEILSELTEDENGEKELIGEIRSLYNDLDEELLITQLSGEYDGNSAILNLHVGVGGTDAQDFTQMLMRMYLRWAEKMGFKTKVRDLLDGEEAGIREAVISIEGDYAYGFLKSEKGIHRLVRISPYNTNGKRQTSFASVEVLPELKEDQDVEINPEDIRTDVFRAGGAGGQHVNRTESAVRMTHIPTGIIVQSQNERSQHINKEECLKMLKAKLVELKDRAHKEKIEELSGELKDMGWGSQIRSYVFNPYQMVKDHRTLAETSAVGDVLDGDIDIFIKSFLKEKTRGGNLKWI